MCFAGTWVSDPIAIFSLVTSIFMAAATIYKYLYHVGIRADPQDMKNIPLDRSVSLKIFCTNMEYQLLNAKLEPHSRNITIPTAEQLYYKDKKYALLAEEVGSGGGDGGGGLADSGGASGNASLTSSLVNPMVNPMVNPTSSGTTNEEDKVVYDSATFAPATTGFPQKQQYQNPTLAEQQQPQQLAQPSTQTSSNTSHFTPLPSSAVVTTATPYNPPSPTPATLSATAACPPELICPLTQRIMSDPVICADGYTYERAAIEQHFRSQQELLAQVGVTGADARFASPTTKERLESTALIPNRSLAALLTKFYASQQES